MISIKELKELHEKATQKECGEDGHPNCRNLKGEMCWVRIGHAKIDLSTVIDARLPEIIERLEDADRMAKWADCDCTPGEYPECLKCEHEKKWINEK